MLAKVLDKYTVAFLCLIGRQITHGNIHAETRTERHTGGIRPATVRIDDDLFRLWVEDGPVANGVAYNAITVGCVLQNKGAEVGRLLVELALLYIGLLTVEVCCLDLGSSQTGLVEVVLSL